MFGAGAPILDQSRKELSEAIDLMGYRNGRSYDSFIAHSSSVLDGPTVDSHQASPPLKPLGFYSKPTTEKSLVPFGRSSVAAFVSVPSECTFQIENRFVPDSRTMR